MYCSASKVPDLGNEGSCNSGADTLFEQLDIELISAILLPSGYIALPCGITTALKISQC